MSTIEERLDEHAIACQSIAVDLIYRHPEDDVYSDIDTRDAIEAAIIAGWNAMISVLDMLLLDFDETKPHDDHPGWWGCRYCKGEKYSCADRHTPDKCPVAAAQDAIAAMEGGE